MNKQKLQEQIETMKAELAKMETELAECEKIELKDTGYYLNTNGSIVKGVHSSAKNGATRATKELAEIASKNMITRNKLEAYAHQIDPEWREDWSKGTSGNYFIGFDNMSKEYRVSNLSNTKDIGLVYMSKSTAEQICEWLNDGKIEL